MQDSSDVARYIRREIEDRAGDVSHVANTLKHRALGQHLVTFLYGSGPEICSALQHIGVSWSRKTGQGAKVYSTG